MSLFATANWLFWHNEKFLCLNQISNFKQHGWDNAKGAKLCNFQVEITFNKMFSSKINLLLYQTEIISLLLYVIALAQGRNFFFYTLWDIFRFFIHDSLFFLVKLRKLLIPGYLPCSKGGWLQHCLGNFHQTKTSPVLTAFY